MIPPQPTVVNEPKAKRNLIQSVLQVPVKPRTNWGKVSMQPRVSTAEAQHAWGAPKRPPPPVPQRSRTPSPLGSTTSAEGTAYQEAYMLVRGAQNKQQKNELLTKIAKFKKVG